jgi:hypothetical protein
MARLSLIIRLSDGKYCSMATMAIVFVPVLAPILLVSVLAACLVKYHHHFASSNTIN